MFQCSHFVCHSRQANLTPSSFATEKDYIFGGCCIFGMCCSIVSSNYKSCSFFTWPDLIWKREREREGMGSLQRSTLLTLSLFCYLGRVLCVCVWGPKSERECVCLLPSKREREREREREAIELQNPSLSYFPGMLQSYLSHHFLMFTMFSCYCNDDQHCKYCRNILTPTSVTLAVK